MFLLHDIPVLEHLEDSCYHTESGPMLMFLHFLRFFLLRQVRFCDDQ